MLKKVPRSPRCLTRPPTDKKKGPEVVVLNYENVLQVQNHLRIMRKVVTTHLFFSIYFLVGRESNQSLLVC